VDCYNIFLHGLFSFFLWFISFFFSNWSLSILFFLYWAGWEFSFVVFSKITLWIATMFPPHGFCFVTVFPHVFLFKLSLSNLFFQYWAGWELRFSFPLMFVFQFFLFFSELFLSILFFYYWDGWEFSFLVFFSLKHCGLLQCFPVWFFFIYFFVFFQNYLCWFYFFHIELIEILALLFFKTLWIATVFPHMIFALLQCFPTYFFNWFFFKIVFIEFIFFILSWLEI